MGATVGWRLADLRTDRRAVKAFTCTDKERWIAHQRRRDHRSPWELDVQKWLREEALRGVPADLDRRTGLTNDERGIRAIACHQKAPLEAEAIGRPVRLIMGIAIRSDLRRAGGALANEAMAWTLGDILAREPSPVLVLGALHRRNQASRRLVARNGFERMQTLESRFPVSEHEIWAVELRP